PGSDQLGVALDGLDGHAGGSQLGADHDPVEVELVVAATAAGGAVDGGDHEAGPLVVAQRMHAHPGPAGRLGDGQARRGDGTGWRLGGRGLRAGRGIWTEFDFEHALNHSVDVMPELSQRRRASVLAICCASIVVVVMDISIVNVALPAMRRDLHASVSGLQWTVDAYTLVLASFTADRVGRRRVFQVGLTAFGLGSLLCSLAPGIGWLIAARVLQAAGGTMLNPATLAIVANTFTGAAERARAIGVFGSMSGLALALGPILGGGLVDAFGWRSVFWINLPIVAVAIVGAALFVPDSRAARPRRFDPVGQVLTVLVLGSVVYAIIESTSLGWTSPVIVGLLAVAALSVAGILCY